MKLIVGLGNPGKKYENTRHNVGFMVIDALASQITNYKLLITNEFQTSKKAKAEYLNFKIGEEAVELIKPLTFMNTSGVAVAKLSTYYKLQTTDIYIVHDDLDIRLGEFKIQKGVGPQLHYGIESIEKSLGTKDFWRVRIGVENRPASLKIFNFRFRRRIPGEKYVLQSFTDQEQDIISGVIGKIVDELLDILK